MCDNIKVAIKVRPLIRLEKEARLTSQWRIKENTIAPIDPNPVSEPYCFDHIFDETKSTQSLFEVVAKPIIQNCMKGINGTIFAYGQTSSGKTYTMAGTDTEMGIIPLSIHQIFHEIESMAPERQFLLRIAYIEIYNEKIFDLLDGKLTELKIRDTQNTSEARVKCHEIIVNSSEKILHYLAEGNSAKRVDETKMNERSSRSHTIFRITIESRTIPNETEGTDEGVVQISNLNLVDLAGSEKADQTGTTGVRLIEGSFINRSLFSLGFVIKQLSEKGPDTFINYRDSKLTRILQASLGGNSMTTIICTITPATVEETNYTLFFASRAKTIKNKPIINETVSETTVMRRMQKEISRLKGLLTVEERKNSKNCVRIEELERDINERETKFVGSSTIRAKNKARRRTWCPSSTQNDLSVVYEENEADGFELKLRPSKLSFLSNDLNRDGPTQVGYVADFGEIESTNPVFLLRPTENNLSFGTNSEQSLSSSFVITTPPAFRKKSRANIKCADNCLCDQLEKELTALEEFTRLENKFDSKSSSEFLPPDYQELKNKVFEKDIKLEILSSRNSELELQVNRLDAKQTSAVKMEKDLEKITKDLSEAIKSKEAADQAKVCAEYEYDQLKKRTSSREKELTNVIEELRNSDKNAKVIAQIKELENKIKEMENLVDLKIDRPDTRLDFGLSLCIHRENQKNLLLQSDIIGEKQKYESLDKINCQLISDLEQEKSKFQTYITESQNTIQLFKENNKKLEKNLDNEKNKLIQLEEENLALSNELENNKKVSLNKVEPCEKCAEFTEKLDTEYLRYGKLKQDFDSVISNDLREIQNVILTLQHYLKSLASEESSGKENKSINDYVNDLKLIFSSTPTVLTEKQSSNENLNQSIEEFSTENLAIKNSSFILSSHDELTFESLQNRTIDLENQIIKISNQLNKEFDTKALQTEWRFDEFVIVNTKYTELQSSFTKLQAEYDGISTGILDWIKENEEIRKQLRDQTAKYDELNDKYKALVEKQTLEEHKELISLRTNYEEALKFNQSLQENLNDFSSLKSKFDNLFDEKRQLEEQLIEKIAENELQHSIETKYEQLLSDKNSLEQKFAELLQSTETMTDSIEISTINGSEETPDEKSRKQSLNELSLLQQKYNDLVLENQSVVDNFNELCETNKELLQNFEILTTQHESVRNSLTHTSEKYMALEKYRDFIKFKYTSIIQEYRLLFSSVSNYETKINNLEKETKALKGALVDFELIQNKYEKLWLEKVGADNSSGGDDSDNCEINAKKLVDEIAVLNDKFEAVVSERNLVEANYDLLRYELNAATNMLDIQSTTVESFRQKYEDVLVEKAEQQKIIDEQKINYEEQLITQQEVVRRIILQNQILEQTNSDLQTERDGFLDKISTLNGALSDLNDKFNSLSEKHTESNKWLDDSREIEKSLQQNIISLSGNISELQGKNEEFEQVIETMKISLEKANLFEKKCSAILIEKQTVEKQLEDLSFKNEEMEQVIGKLKSSLDKASGFEKKYSAIFIEKQIADKQLKDLSVEREMYEQKFNEMQTAFEELQRTTKQDEEKHIKHLAKLTETQESKEAMEAQLRSEIVVFERKCEKYSIKIQEMQAACEELQHATKQADENRIKLLAKLTEIEESKAAMETELKSEIVTMQQKCLKDSIKMREMQATYEELQQATKQAEENRIKLLTKLTETQESKAVMEAQLRSEIVAIEQRCDNDLQTCNKTLEEFKCNLREVEATKSLELESVRQLFEKKYNELERNKTKLKEELKFKINSIQNEYKEIQKSEENLKSELKALETEKTNLHQKLIELEEDKSCTEQQLKSQLDSVKNEFENLQITLKILNNDKTSIEQEYKSQISSLNQKYGEMEKDLKSQLNTAQRKYEILQNKAKGLWTVQDKYHKLQASYEELETTKVMMEKNINSVQQNSDRLQITIKTLEHKKLAIEQNLAQLQLEHDALKEQHTLLLRKASELEKTVASLQEENKTLKLSKQDLETSLKIQAAQIQAINTRLTESETKQIKLKADHEAFEKKSKSLQVELDTLKSQSKSLADHSTELKDKSKRIEILENKKKELLAQIHELQNMHLFKTGQLESEIKALKTHLEESKKNSIASKNKLLNENFDLKKKNQTLFVELDDIRRKQNDRKARRSLTYDNNRSILLDVQTVGTMTDKVDPSCNCDMMDEKIKELTRENYIKKCHIANYQIKEKHNPLVTECSDLREKLALSENCVVDLQKQVAQLNIKLRKVREISINQSSTQTPTRPSYKTVGTNTEPIKPSPNKHRHHDLPTSKSKPVCHVQTTNRLIQTEFSVNHESRDEHHTTIRQLEAEINRLRMRYEESKCLAIARRRKIDMLNEQIAKFQRS